MDFTCSSCYHHSKNDEESKKRCDKCTHSLHGYPKWEPKKEEEN